MKRSELIDKIVEVINAKHYGELVSDPEFPKRLVTTMLDVAETAGILPPRAQVLKRSTMTDDDGEIIFDEMISIPANEWESEDETK